MTHSMTALAMTALTALCATLVAQETPAFHAERIVRTGRFSVDTTPDTAFPLFTPLGELHWAKGWKPKVLYPADGQPMEGLLFYTEDHDGTWWWMTRYDPAHFLVEYHVVAPAGFGRNIRVRCKAAGTGTEVVVTDTYIGLTEHGNQYLRSLDEAAYAQKIEKGWRQPITDYLKRSR